MLNWLMFSSNFSAWWALQVILCWYEWRITGYRPHWSRCFYHQRSRIWLNTCKFPLKRCNICQLNKGKPLHKQRSRPKDFPVTSYPQGATNADHLNQGAYLSNWLQPTHIEIFCVSVLPSDNRSHALQGVLFHISVLFDGWTKSCRFFSNGDELRGRNNILNNICCSIALYKSNQYNNI